MKPSKQTLLKGAAIAAGALPGAAAPAVANTAPTQQKSNSATVEGNKQPGVIEHSVKTDTSTTPAGVPGESRGSGGIPSSIEYTSLPFAGKVALREPFKGDSATIKVVAGTTGPGIGPAGQTPNAEGYLPTEEPPAETGVDTGASLPPQPAVLPHGESTVTGAPTPPNANPPS
jgi:hypothetical protein